MEKGQKVILKSFNGTTTPKENCEERENYWRLLNENGTLINFAHEKGFHNKNRVLIKFNIDVKSQGLECHNEEPNSLWILKSDLIEI